MKELLQSFVGSFGYRIEKIRSRLPGPELIVLDLILQTLNSQLDGNVTFVEIGANDGQHEDPLYPWIQRFPWRGVLVEPQPLLCGRLRDLYMHREDIAIVQAAIGPQRGTAILWCVQEIEGEPDLSGIASLDRETMLRHRNRIPDIESRLQPIEIPVMSLEDLLSTNNIEQVDVLQIDAEGYDLEIIKMIDFTRVKPAVINYEHCNLNWEDQFACRKLLQEQGYGFATYLGDTVAVKSGLLPATLDRRMCQL